MRHRLVILAASAVLALTVAAGPAAAGPVTVFTLPAVEAGDNGGPLAISCGPNTYTATGGTIRGVTRDPSQAAHLTIVGVSAVDQTGRGFRIVGAETYNDPAGRFTSKVMMVRTDGGGIVDSINIVARYRDGVLAVGHDAGTCGF